MKTLLRLFALTALIAGPVAFAADAASAAPAKGEKPDTELTKKMDKIGGAFRKLRKQAGDASKNADSLEQVAIIKQYATEASKLEPLKASEVPAADKAKMIAGYKAEMKDFLAAVDKLEAAFKANNNNEAAKLVQELGKMQKEGHKEYKSKNID